MGVVGKMTAHTTHGGQRHDFGSLWLACVRPARRNHGPSPSSPPTHSPQLPAHSSLGTPLAPACGDPGRPTHLRPQGSFFSSVFSTSSCGRVAGAGGGGGR